MNIDHGIITACLATMCIAAFGIIFSKNLVSSTITSGVFSLLAVTLYSLMKAPDVAITEVAVGSALSTVFLILTIGAIGSEKDRLKPIAPLETGGQQTYSNAVKIISTGMLFFFLLHIVALFPRFGDPSSIVNMGVGQFYIGFSDKHFGVHNVVTAVLGGYRGFDTLIETTVGFCAAFGVSQILSEKERF